MNKFSETFGQIIMTHYNENYLHAYLTSENFNPTSDDPSTFHLQNPVDQEVAITFDNDPDIARCADKKKCKAGTDAAKYTINLISEIPPRDPKHQFSTKQIKVEPGSYTQTIYFKNLHAGSYFVEIIN